MFNLSFKTKQPPRGYCSEFKHYIEQEDANGRVVLVECKDPYEGLSADSFSLQAQLDAGVPLEHISPVSLSSLSSVDKNNSQAELFVEKLSKSIVSPVNE